MSLASAEQPPEEEDAIKVNASVGAFQRAPDFPKDDRASADIVQISRYPAILP